VDKSIQDNDAGTSRQCLSLHLKATERYRIVDPITQKPCINKQKHEDINKTAKTVQFLQ
jgi:hypothetical protein